MCLELYYQMKSTATVNKPRICVVVRSEELQVLTLACSNGDNRTAWDRMFVKLPDGFHDVIVAGLRSYTSYCGMSVDDVFVQPCHVFGEFCLNLNSTRSGIMYR